MVRLGPHIVLRIEADLKDRTYFAFRLLQDLEGLARRLLPDVAEQALEIFFGDADRAADTVNRQITGGDQAAHMARADIEALGHRGDSEQIGSAGSLAADWGNSAWHW